MWQELATMGRAIYLTVSVVFFIFCLLGIKALWDIKTAVLETNRLIRQQMIWTLEKEIEMRKSEIDVMIEQRKTQQEKQEMI